MKSIAGDGKEYTYLGQFLDSLKSVIVRESQIIDDTVNDPSTLTPVAGNRYIVGSAPVGAWAGKNRQIAVYVGPGWEFIDPSNKIFHVGVSTGGTDRVMFYDGLYYVNGAGNQGAYVDVGQFAAGLTLADAEEISLEAALIFGA
jgi:hypothetical protein